MSSEAFARAENSSDLGMKSGVVHDIDRVIAIAGGDTLGGLLFRVRDAGQPQWSRRVVLILARRMMGRHHLGRAIAEAAAAVALEEFVFPHCRVCGGARELMGANLKVTCDACGGSGRQRYSDAHRRARIGTYGRLIDLGIADAHKDMNNAVSGLLARAHGRLG